MSVHLRTGLRKAMLNIATCSSWHAMALPVFSNQKGASFHGWQAPVMPSKVEPQPYFRAEGSHVVQKPVVVENPLPGIVFFIVEANEAISAGKLE